MSDIQFNEPEYGSRNRFAPKDGLPTRLVMKLGLAKNKDQAQKVLLIIGALALVVTYVVGFGGSKSAPVEDIPVDAGAVGEINTEL